MYVSLVPVMEMNLSVLLYGIPYLGSHHTHTFLVSFTKAALSYFFVRNNHFWNIGSNPHYIELSDFKTTEQCIKLRAVTISFHDF